MQKVGYTKHLGNSCLMWSLREIWATEQVRNPTELVSWPIYSTSIVLVTTLENLEKTRQNLSHDNPVRKVKELLSVENDVPRRLSGSTTFLSYLSLSSNKSTYFTF